MHTNMYFTLFSAIKAVNLHKFYTDECDKCHRTLNGPGLTEMTSLHILGTSPLVHGYVLYSTLEKSESIKTNQC